MTASGKMYLKAIYYLSRGGATRPADIADALGVSRPSVSNALLRLTNEGMLTHEPYSDVRLTSTGHGAAQTLAAADERLRKMGSLCAL
jgi:DtxR family Mn-dependent transcriptional regulator